MYTQFKDLRFNYKSYCLVDDRLGTLTGKYFVSKVSEHKGVRLKCMKVGGFPDSSNLRGSLLLLLVTWKNRFIINYYFKFPSDSNLVRNAK